MTELQTAMMLTQQEWDDLAEMVAYYRRSTARSGTGDLGRRRRLASRIIEANQ